MPALPAAARGVRRLPGARCCALALLLWAWPAAAPARLAPAGAERGLARLEQAVGRYPREVGLWDQHLLHERVRKLVGRRFPFFRSNMWNTGVVSRDGPLLYVTGTRQQWGGLDGAALVADLDRDAIWVWIMISGRRYEYRERPLQPAEVELFLRHWERPPGSVAGAPPTHP
jgi:hypothetical protein